MSSDEDQNPEFHIHKRRMENFEMLTNLVEKNCPDTNHGTTKTDIKDILDKWGRKSKFYKVQTEKRTKDTEQSTHEEDHQEQRVKLNQQWKRYLEKIKEEF